MAVTMAALHKYPFGCTRHAIYLLPILALPMSYAVAYGWTRGVRVGVRPVREVVLLIVIAAPIATELGIIMELFRLRRQ